MRGATGEGLRPWWLVKRRPSRLHPTPVHCHYRKTLNFTFPPLNNFQSTAVSCSAIAPPDMTVSIGVKLSFCLLTKNLRDELYAALYS